MPHRYSPYFLPDKKLLQHCPHGSQCFQVHSGKMFFRLPAHDPHPSLTPYCSRWSLLPVPSCRHHRCKFLHSAHPAPDICCCHNVQWSQSRCCPRDWRWHILKNDPCQMSPRRRQKCSHSYPTSHFLSHQNDTRSPNRPLSPAQAITAPARLPRAPLLFHLLQRRCHTPQPLLFLSTRPPSLYRWMLPFLLWRLPVPRQAPRLPEDRSHSKVSRPRGLRHWNSRRRFLILVVLSPLFSPSPRLLQSPQCSLCSWLFLYLPFRLNLMIAYTARLHYSLCLTDPLHSNHCLPLTHSLPALHFSSHSTSLWKFPQKHPWCLRLSHWWRSHRMSAKPNITGMLSLFLHSLQIS